MITMAKNLPTTLDDLRANGFIVDTMITRRPGPSQFMVFLVRNKTAMTYTGRTEGEAVERAIEGAAEDFRC